MWSMRSVAGLVLVGSIVLVPSLGRAQSRIDGDSVNARIDAVFSALDGTRSPGCALGVVEGGRLTLGRGYGMANLDDGVPNGPSTVFRIGSMSKQFAAASILLLEADGKLSLEDDVRRYLPELPDFGEKITIRHFINHTSGIRDMLTLMSLRGLRGDDFYTPQDVLELLSRQQDLNFPVNSEYLYSNSGYQLLGMIVQRVSGRTLREFAHERIFEPLGMTSTRFHDDHTEIVARRAVGYASRPQGGYRISTSPLDIVGAGGLLTTVEDFARWLRNFDEQTVGGESFTRRMLERGVLVGGDTISYAIGLTVGRYRGLPTVGHGGSWRGYRSNFIRFPDQDVAITVFCNASTANPSSLARAVADIVLAGALGPQVAQRPQAPPAAANSGAVALTPSQLAEFAGDYHSEELGVTYTIRVENGALALTAPVTRRASFEPVGTDSFSARGNTFRFVRDSRGRITEVRLDAGRVRNMRLIPAQRR